MPLPPLIDLSSRTSCKVAQELISLAIRQPIDEPDNNGQAAVGCAKKEDVSEGFVSKLRAILGSQQPKAGEAVDIDVRQLVKRGGSL